MKKEMTEEAKAKLRATPTRRCSICKTPRSYTNPIENCSKCNKPHCYDHLFGVVEKEGVINYCDGCYVR